MSVKKHYNFFLENGDLFDLNESAKGQWELDKKWFTILYESTIKGADEINVDYERED